jgi:hypothetical protein
VTIEDAAELQLQQDHVVRLETRPPNIEGTGAVTATDLVKNALRMRPERIIIGECRGGETLDMLQAMNTGHDGSLTTIHANNPRDGVARLETMVMMSGFELPIKAIRQQISSAVNVIIQANRLQGGPRRVTHITEITGMEQDTVVMQDIYRFCQTGIDEDGKAHGHFECTGFAPASCRDWNPLASVCQLARSVSEPLWKHNRQPHRPLQSTTTAPGNSSCYQSSSAFQSDWVLPPLSGRGICAFVLKQTTWRRIGLSVLTGNEAGSWQSHRASYVLQFAERYEIES